MVVSYDATGGVVGQLHHPGPGRTDHWTCVYWDAGVGKAGATPIAITPTVGQIIILVCAHADGTVADMTQFAFDPADPFGGIDLPAEAAAQALAQLHLPDPAIAVNPPGTQLVGIDTWLWTTNTTTLQASATLGDVTATVTATPTHTTWTIDPEGTTVDCPAHSPAYDMARSPDDQTTTCSALIEDAGPHQLTATTIYAITWTATTGDGGPLDRLTRTATIPLAVDQAQALIN